MNIRKLILRAAEKNGRVTTKEIINETGFSRAYINRYFQELCDEGRIVLAGKANRAHYVALTEDNLKTLNRDKIYFHRILKNLNIEEHQIFMEIKDATGIFLNVKKNILDIINYAFTEMLNNAIEHSQSDKIEVEMRRESTLITFRIHDWGVGIFQNIMQKMNLENIMTAIEDLLKGKQTTAPAGHSGEGIFFTSKAADTLIISGSSKKLIFQNLIDDIFIRDIKAIKGTKVYFKIDVSSQKHLANIFDKYTFQKDSFEFAKTEVRVRLYKQGSDYISRSQARRILNALEKFKSVVLDFKNIDMIGQGFADEIFRIWKNNHPGIEIIPIHLNENIAFMIKHVQK